MTFFKPPTGVHCRFVTFTLTLDQQLLSGASIVSHGHYGRISAPCDTLQYVRVLRRDQCESTCIIRIGFLLFLPSGQGIWLSCSFEFLLYLPSGQGIRLSCYWIPCRLSFGLLVGYPTFGLLVGYPTFSSAHDSIQTLDSL